MMQQGGNGQERKSVDGEEAADKNEVEEKDSDRAATVVGKTSEQEYDADVSC